MNPTFIGYISSTRDALLIIQAVLNQQLTPVSRRPHDRERSQLIKSGNVFIFIEEKSGIKRWTDGVAWSPSRILGRFLVYRELDRGALKDSNSLKRKRESNRNLVGSLITSYAFKPQGLIKKTLSLTINYSNNKIDDGNSINTVHLVSYYSAEDVLQGKLNRPINIPEFKDLHLSNEIWQSVKENSLGGKIPIEDEDYYSIYERNPNAEMLGFNSESQLQSQQTIPNSNINIATTTTRSLPKAQSFSGIPSSGNGYSYSNYNSSFSSNPSSSSRQSSTATTSNFPSFTTNNEYSQYIPTSILTTNSNYPLSIPSLSKNFQTTAATTSTPSSSSSNNNTNTNNNNNNTSTNTNNSNLQTSIQQNLQIPRNDNIISDIHYYPNIIPQHPYQQQQQYPYQHQNNPLQSQPLHQVSQQQQQPLPPATATAPPPPPPQQQQQQLYNYPTLVSSQGLAPGQQQPYLTSFSTIPPHYQTHHLNQPLSSHDHHHRQQQQQQQHHHHHYQHQQQRPWGDQQPAQTSHQTQGYYQ
ncbi:hypothetical protein WICMUC_000756 [Wickerhamomyces mucosus]|uniref:Uncharacterized protein n=1 Tax=Wickerhamomyces mucosus TaxID=1378264 RepID=A0A9P8PY70_9ASCO|nr:hypothetical protein WICMUC_000756 [Wickerhamomyces mucosus]